MSTLSVTPSKVSGQTAAKILSFLDLLAGWHYGDGVPPAKETVDLALRLISSGFEKTNAFPGIEGEIQLTAYVDSLCLEFTIEPDGGITFVMEQNGLEIAYESALTLDEAIDRLRMAMGEEGLHQNHSSEVKLGIVRQAASLSGFPGQSDWPRRATSWQLVGHQTANR